VASDVAVPWDIAYFIEFLKFKLGPHNAQLIAALSAAPISPSSAQFCVARFRGRPRAGAPLRFA
jgi:hypothetical protein